VAEGVILKPSTFTRYDRNMRLVERFLPPPPQGRAQQVQVSEPRLRFQCQAFSGSVGNIPQYACVEPTSPTRQDEDGNTILSVRKPQTDSSSTCALVWHTGILANNGTTESGIGLCTFEPFWALYDPDEAAPAFGVDLGTVADEWFLRAGNVGYKSLGATRDGAVLVRKGSDAGFSMVLVELDGTLAAGGSAPALLLEWTGTVWDDTGSSITVYDSTNKLSGAANARFWSTPNETSGRWELIAPADAGVDEKVKVTAADTTADYLDDSITDDTHWIDTEIVNPGDDEQLRIKHIGPRSGETTTTIGQATEKISGATDATSHNFASSPDAGEIWVVTAWYQPVDNTSVELFTRRIVADSLGHLNFLSGETNSGTITIDTGAGSDEKLAVANGETPGFLEDIAKNWNVGAYVSASDPTVYFEQDGATAQFIAYLWWSDDQNYNVGSAQTYGHNSNGEVVHWDYVGDSWIAITEDEPNSELEFTHIGPVSGETATTIGTNAEKVSGSSDGTALDLTATTNAGAFWYMAAFYQPIADDDVTIYFRKASVDSKGHLYAVSGESAGATITIAAGTASEDKKLAVVSTSTSGFLEDIATDFNSGAFISGSDPKVYFERDGVTDQFIAYLWWSDDPNYNAGACQFYGHMSDGTVAHIDLVGDSWITVTEDEPNFEVEVTHTGPVSGETLTTIGATIAKPTGAANTTAFDFTASPNAGAKWAITAWYQSIAGGDVDVYAGLFAFDSKGHAYNLGGEVYAGTITMPTGGGGTDTKLAVVNGSTAGELEDIATAWHSSPLFELNNDPIVWFENNAGQFHAYLDWSLDANYSASSPQLFGHISDASIAHIDLVGDQWISITEDAPNFELEFEHVGPVSEGTGSTVGQQSPTGSDVTGDSDSFAADGTNWVHWHTCSRLAWDSSLLRIVQFTRTWKNDKKGHSYSISSESGPSTVLDCKALPGYSGSGKWALIVDAGVMKWMAIGGC
jgi:hypothetical protein